MRMQRKYGNYALGKGRLLSLISNSSAVIDGYIFSSSKDGVSLSSHDSPIYLITALERRYRGDQGPFQVLVKDSE